MEPRSPRVLVAEDYVSLREVLSERLRRAGFEVEAIEDGAGVLGAVAEGFRSGVPFSAVITDLKMRSMGGIEATRLLRSHGFDLPVLWMTATPKPTDALEAAELGVLRMLPKPFDLGEAVTLLREALESRSRPIAAVPSSELSWLSANKRHPAA